MFVATRNCAAYNIVSTNRSSNLIQSLPRRTKRWEWKQFCSWPSIHCRWPPKSQVAVNNELLWSMQPTRFKNKIYIPDWGCYDVHFYSTSTICASASSRLQLGHQWVQEFIAHLKKNYKSKEQLQLLHNLRLTKTANEYKTEPIK
jgi:hypothetical protein